MSRVLLSVRQELDTQTYYQTSSIMILIESTETVLRTLIGGGGDRKNLSLLNLQLRMIDHNHNHNNNHYHHRFYSP
jgi:hypothetical protein